MRRTHLRLAVVFALFCLAAVEGFAVWLPKMAAKLTRTAKNEAAAARPSHQAIKTHAKETTAPPEQISVGQSFGVFKVQFSDGSVWFAKAGNGNKAMASAAVDKMLQLGLVPETRQAPFTGSHGQRVHGFIMRFSDGSAAEDYHKWRHEFLLRREGLKSRSDQHFKELSKGPRLLPFEQGKLDFFDYLTNQRDRHGGNYLVKKKGKAVAIDNDDSFSAKQVLPPWALKSAFDLRYDHLDQSILVFARTKEGKAAIDRLNKLTPEEFNNNLKPFLTTSEIEAFLKRRAILLKWLAYKKNPPHQSPPPGRS